MTNEEAKDYIREWCPYDRQDEIIKALSNSDKEAYRKGYKDGQDALAYHLELCKEEEGATTSSMESLVKPCKDCKKEQELKTLVKENKKLKKELKSVKRELEQMKIQSNWEKYPDMMGK